MTDFKKIPFLMIITVLCLSSGPVHSLYVFETTEPSSNRSSQTRVRTQAPVSQTPRVITTRSTSSPSHYLSSTHRSTTTASPSAAVPQGQDDLLLPICGCDHPRCRMTSPFGPRRDPVHGARRFHAGIDLGGPVDRPFPIMAAKSGTVTFAGRKGGRGITATIVNRGGIRNSRGQMVGGPSSTVEHQYNHLKRVVVEDGQYVKTGDIVGYMGSTGHSSGPHLDYKMKIDGQYQNPMLFLANSIQNVVKGSGNFGNTLAGICAPGGVFASSAAGQRVAL